MLHRMSVRVAMWPFPAEAELNVEEHSVPLDFKECRGRLLHLVFMSDNRSVAGSPVTSTASS